MAATLRSKSALIDESTGLYKDNTAGDISAQDLRDGVYSIYQPQGICGGRLTTETGVPISTSDRTSQGTLYFTPYLHNLVGLYDGTSWTLHTFTERSLSLSMTSGVNYDVFIYDNAGTLTLELTAWTNDTTRATALVRQDGVYVKTGATTRLYLGTIRASGTNVTEDSLAKRFIWNCYNRASRPVRVLEATDSWTYATASWRQARASTANQIALVCGEAGEAINLKTQQLCGRAADGEATKTGIGENSTSAIATGCCPDQFQIYTSPSGGTTSISSSLTALPRTGYSYYAWLEYGHGSSTQTWYGDAGAPTHHQSGIAGDWKC
jgi:hypothetical protein